FAMIQFSLFFYCIVEGVRATSDCLSEEERNGTLGLLFLTELRGFDVVMGKLISAATNSFYIFLGLLPLSGITLMLGGVTGGQFWRTNSILIFFLFFCLSCGMFASSRSYKEGSAGLLTVFLVTVVCVSPIAIGRINNYLGWFSDFSPWTLLQVDLTRPSLSANSSTLVCLCALFFVSCLLIVLAGLRVEKYRSTLCARIQEAGLITAFFSRPRNDPEMRRRALEEEPVRYLLLRYRSTGLLVGIIGGSNLALGVVAAIGGYEPLLWVSLGVGWVSLKILLILLVSRAAGFFNSLRESGSLELLLTTPLSPEKIIIGCEEGLAKTFFIPMALVFAGLIIGAFGVAFRSPYSGGAAQGSLGFVAVYMAFFLGDYHSAKWVAMANGLNERKAGTAFFKTLFFVFVLPLFTFIVPLINLIAFLGWPLIWCVWGSGKVRKTLSHWSEYNHETREAGSWFFFWKEKHPHSLAVPPRLPPPPIPTSFS
ncbi:MAG: hypothetical protein JWM04_1651, partial [Verrucomicrobiales bacterium]|nr:hypothetical protein [Verrucomicrobiales bacterium]